MTVTGQSIIAGVPTSGTEGTTNSINPATGEALEPAFGLVSQAQLTEATVAAEAAFDAYRATSPEERAAFLEQIAANIEAIGPELTERAVAESGLAAGRIDGERGRTVAQLRLFAAVVRQGDHQEVRVDPELADRQPASRLDIRPRQIPLGPVAVFGASNFPLAFSTAGGDTASALAAGCPVVVKAHNAHPGTAELVGQAVAAAVASSNLPAGVFSIIFGGGTSIGQALVKDPRIRAVGFTGSRSGGLALMKTAAERPEPIPVYAEMSSINPVFMLAGALAANAADLGSQFVASLTMGSGQFCTNPGLLFVPEGADGDTFVNAAAAAVQQAAGQTMLSAGIAEACALGTAKLAGTPGVERIAEGKLGEGMNAPAPGLYSTTAAAFASEPVLQEEIFGSAGLVIRYSTAEQLPVLTESLEGQLTATVHSTAEDNESVRSLLPVLERKIGRILFNGWPTGVEVGHAMVHGGPFPATSDSRTTSVGTLAIYRFQRPVSYQNAPAEVLPEALREENPWNLNRRVDGTVIQPGGARG